MKRIQGIAVLVVALAGMIGAAQAPSEDFYVTRLRQGEAALNAQRPNEAIDQLRIANFGLLDRPALLEEGLAFLTLAYAQAERPHDVDATITRFVEVESRFGVYAKAALEPDVRARFEDLLQRRVRPEALAQMPALKHLAQAPKKTEKKKK